MSTENRQKHIRKHIRHRHCLKFDFQNSQKYSLKTLGGGGEFKNIYFGIQTEKQA